MNIKLKEKVAKLPEAPGVYLFKDAQGKIIYIGKAKSLKKRVQTYFSRDLSSKTQILVSKISDIEYKITPSESQAQLLEASLIKDHLPQYNISLKDDKSFPLIRISDQEFPIVSICRRKRGHKIDTATYFGPYTNSALVREALKMMRRIFGFRSCKKLPKSDCLYGRINLCPAPCTGKVNAKQYQEIIRQIKMFLESKYEDLLRTLTDKMHQAAQEKKFEEAAQIRDRLNALSTIAQAAVGWNTQDELQDLKNLLHLSKLPQRIEAFDISNISGKEATGSMASFFRGLPDKNNYRRFRIKTVNTIDDYGMLREVIKRRYTRVLEGNLSRPDLILIDGGKGHLSTAAGEIGRLGLKIPLVSIAKDQENIYTKNFKNPIRLNSDTPALNLIRRIRDEAHRFAIKYHHLLHRKKIIGR